jgi:hypothetical protein
MELAAKKFLANPADDKDDAALLRRQFETWAANDAPFERMAENNKFLAEAIPLSKDLAALGEAGIKLLDWLTPPPPPPAEPKKKKPRKPSKAELAAQAAAQQAQTEWLVKENAELDRLSRPPARANAAMQSASPDVLLAAFRPVKVLAAAVHP